MNIRQKINSDLKKGADNEKAKLLGRYFKTGKGEYGEGDKFLGLTMPQLRLIAKKYQSEISLAETLKLLQSRFHEERMLSLLLLMLKYKKGDEAQQQKIFAAYLGNTKFINNWDLVDVTCRDIVGAHVFAGARQSPSGDKKYFQILYRLAKSESLWERRIAIVATFYFISKNELTETFKISQMLLSDKHDLIHKAVGWALREAGKKDKAELVAFLNAHLRQMPRTTLRYAIERFPQAERKRYLTGF